jgi:acyl-CoA thioesterase I
MGLCRAAAVLIGLAATAAVGASAAAAQPTACDAPESVLSERSTLPAAAKALRNDHRLRVLAVGSLSTAGAGTSPTASWPVRLEASLRQRFPGDRIEVFNRGRPKTDAATMLARLPEDVAETRPDLVVWESGAMDAVRGADVDIYRQTLMDGVDALAGRSVDTVLMDAQFSRAYSAVVDFQPYVTAVQQIGDMRDLVIFRRHALMRHWVDSGRLSAEDLGRPVRLDIADRIYDCIGRLLAGMIADAVTRAAP